MGRGQTGIGKIVPPKGWRWAPKTNAFARCVGTALQGGRGGRQAFADAAAKCKGTRGG